MDTEESNAESNESPEIPPLDAVDSRWWYWIAAYPIVLFLFIPVMMFGVVFLLMPFAFMGPDPGAPALPVFGVLFALPVMFLLFTVLLVTFAVIVMLPVALYLDARKVAQADLEWQPDPFLYGILGVLQVIATPIIGLIVSIYYLYRRHEHVGVP